MQDRPFELRGGTGKYPPPSLSSTLRINSLSGTFTFWVRRFNNVLWWRTSFSFGSQFLLHYFSQLFHCSSWIGRREVCALTGCGYFPFWWQAHPFSWVPGEDCLDQFKSTGSFLIIKFLVKHLAQMGFSFGMVLGRASHLSLCHIGSIPSWCFWLRCRLWRF